MNSLVSTLKKTRVGKLPQIGLRLVNNLQEGHTSDKFWFDYIELVRNPENFRKLSPHSKCLLTCVFTKLEKRLFRKTKSQELLNSIYSDIISNKCISVLNLELINMVLVSSYTLRIPLSDHQLDLILFRANEDVCRVFDEYKKDIGTGHRERFMFPIEDSVSIIHSLATLTKYFPVHLNKVRESLVIKNLVSNLGPLLSFVNGREFSLILFSFDKLNLLSVEIAYKFYEFAQNIMDFDSQSLTTSFYISANNGNTSKLFKLLKPSVNSMISDDFSHSTSSSYSRPKPSLTGRECCNILCSLIKCNSFADYHYKFLLEKISLMNLQELCNICSLLISKHYPVSDDFKNALINKLVGSKFDNVIILDLLTVANCFHVWMMQNDAVLNNMISSVCKNGNFIFNDKSVLLLHYLVQLGHFDLNPLLELYQINFDSNKINTLHHIILYNSINILKTALHSIKTNPNQVNGATFNVSEAVLNAIIGKSEDELTKLDFKRLNKLDLLTLGKFPNSRILEKLIDFLKNDTWNHIEVCLNMLKHNLNSDIARRVNDLISTVNIDRFFTLLCSKGHESNHNVNDEIRKFNHLLSIVVLLNNTAFLKRVVHTATIMNCTNFEVLLTILNSCKKLHYLDQDVNFLLRSLVKSFKNNTELHDLISSSIFDALTEYNGHGIIFNDNYHGKRVSGDIFVKNKSADRDKLYHIKNMISDFVNVLYHFDYHNRADKYDHSLTHSINSLDINSIYKLKADSDNDNPFKSNKRNGFGYPDSVNSLFECKILTDKTLFESLLVSLSNLCFNAVAHSSVLVKLLRYHILNLNDGSPAVLKCLAMNNCLNDFSLNELMVIRGIQFHKHTHLIEHNDIQGSVLATLNNLGYRSVAEVQVLDYRIDLLII